jgi:hypothetical protein
VKEDAVESEARELGLRKVKVEKIIAIVGKLFQDKAEPEKVFREK